MMNDLLQSLLTGDLTVSVHRLCASAKVLEAFQYGQGGRATVWLDKDAGDLVFKVIDLQGGECSVRLALQEKERVND